MTWRDLGAARLLAFTGATIVALGIALLLSSLTVVGGAIACAVGVLLTAAGLRAGAGRADAEVAPPPPPTTPRI